MKLVLNLNLYKKTDPDQKALIENILSIFQCTK